MYSSGRSANKNNVAHNWANQITAKGKAGNFYFEGKTIYSYGGHFPIAVIADTCTFFTTRSYSPTTSAHISAAHISAAHSACSHHNVVMCCNPDEAAKGYHENNIQAFENEAKPIVVKLAAARKPEIYLQELAGLRTRMEKYVKTCGKKAAQCLKQKKLAYIYMADADKAAKATVQEREALRLRRLQMKAYEEERRKEAQKRFDEKVKEFRAFEIVTISSYSYPQGSDRNTSYLRYNKKAQRIETSKGVEIPAELAKRFYKWLKAVVKAGGCTEGNCEKKILDFSVEYVNADTFKIGCHTIAMSEADSIATLLKW